MVDILSYATVQFVGLILTAGLSLYVGLVVYRRGLPELRIWFYGNLALLAVFGMSFEGFLPPLLHAGLSNGLSFFTLLSFIFASSTVLGAEPRRALLLVGAALTVLAGLGIVLAGGPRWARLALVSFAIAAVFAHGGRLSALALGRLRLRNGPGMLTGVLAAGALFFGLRGLVFVLHRGAAPFGLRPEAADALSSLLGLVIFSAMDFALLVILMTRVERELTAKVLELDESRNDLQILYDAFTETAGSVDLEELIPRLLDLLRNKLRVDAAVLYLTEAHSEELVLAAQRGLSPEALEALLHRRRGDSVADLAFEEGRAVTRLLSSYPEGPLKSSLDALGLGIMAAVPILARAEALGALAVAYRDPSVLDEAKLVLFETMARQLGSVVRAATLHAELERANARLDVLANTDALTHLPNRRTAIRVLEREISRAKRQKGRIAVIMADIDHFKVFNDRYGHDCGDYVLVRTASLLADSLRSTDLASRWGGEEFLLILGSSEPDGVLKLAERIRQRVEKATWDYEGRKLSVTISLGVSICPPEAGGDAAISKADEALYESKRQGRNRVALSACVEASPSVVEAEVEELIEILPSEEESGLG